MKFEEAFERAWAKTPPEVRPKGDPNIPKILAFFWTMLTEVISEEGGKIVLDDTVFISVNQNIISSPVQKSEKSNKKTASDENDSKTTGKNKKGSRKKKDDAEIDQSEKTPPENPESPVTENPPPAGDDDKVTGNGSGDNE